MNDEWVSRVSGWQPQDWSRHAARAARRRAGLVELGELDCDERLLASRPPSAADSAERERIRSEQSRLEQELGLR